MDIIWSLLESEEEAWLIQKQQQHGILCTKRKFKNAYDAKLYFWRTHILKV